MIHKGKIYRREHSTAFKIIDNTEEENKPGLIFFSDFEKAFDSFDHTCIINCLKYFNF